MDDNSPREHEVVSSNSVRAGKRTYFFDIRATRNKDHFITITESKKTTHADGSVTYQKHKVFLYKEDFEKFSEAFAEAIQKVAELNAQAGSSSSVSFEDLGQ